ncbi:AAA-domain-containing protein [Acephala macrosclerotiorum]|nr:AAA-domain-containing protein [Acephala macrosclerotiorum]
MESVKNVAAQPFKTFVLPHTNIPRARAKRPTSQTWPKSSPQTAATESEHEKGPSDAMEGAFLPKSPNVQWEDAPSEGMCNRDPVRIHQHHYSDIMSKWLGESEKLIKNVLKKARQRSPSIVFINELDAMGSSRDTGSTSNSWLSQIKNELLSQMDGVRIRMRAFWSWEQRTCPGSSIQHSIDDFKGVFVLVCRMRRPEPVYSRWYWR